MTFPKLHGIHPDAIRIHPDLFTLFQLLVVCVDPDWIDDANSDADDGPPPRCSFALVFWSKRPQGSLPSSNQRQPRPPSQQGQATNFSSPVLIYTIKGTFNSSSSGISGSTLCYLI